MANFKLANANAQTVPGAWTMEPATVTALPRVDDAPGSEAEPQHVYLRDPLAPNVVQGDDIAAQNMYRARGVQTRPVVHPISMTVRPWDQDQAWRFSGQHGVLARPPIGPPGEMEPYIPTTRSIFRATPQAWDAGYERYG